jgi:hypothetical protein
MLTQERLMAVLVYDPSTGVFAWSAPRPKVWVGKHAGGLNEDGYRKIRIDGRKYFAHRLAFLYMLGQWPVAEVDHKNGFRDDNRWTNLREATRSENNRNASRRGDNSVGLKGVYPMRGKYVASLQADKKRRFLGTFDCPAAAHFAYIVAADKHHQQFARAA